MLFKLLAIAYVVEYFRPQQILPILGALKITTLLPLGVIAASVIAKVGEDRISNQQVLANRNSKWLLFFMFLLLVSLFTSDVTLYSWNTINTVFAFFLLYFVTVKEVTSLNKIKVIFGALILSHVLLIAVNPALITSPESRSYLNHAYLGDGNDFALSVCILIPMAIFLIQDANSKLLRLAAIAALLVLILAVIGTSSRGGTLGLACVLLYQWWRGRRKILGIVLLAMVVGVVVLYAPPFYFDRLNTITEYETEGSAQGRLTAWRASIRMVRDHPILGVGSGHFPVKYGTEYFPPEIEGPSPWLTAHSIYFLILGELGIPGIIFLLVVIYGTLWRYDRRIVAIRDVDNPKRKRLRQFYMTLNSSMVAYAVAGAFLSAVYYPHIFVLLALYAASDEIVKREFADLADGATPPSTTGDTDGESPDPAWKRKKGQRWSNHA